MVAVARAMLAAIFIVLSMPPVVVAWNGYDWERGDFVEIDSGNLVRRGGSIEIYDHSTDEYREVEVERVRERATCVEVEVYDSETGEYRTLEMDDD